MDGNDEGGVSERRLTTSLGVSEGTCREILYGSIVDLPILPSFKEPIACKKCPRVSFTLEPLQVFTIMAPSLSETVTVLSSGIMPEES